MRKLVFASALLAIGVLASAQDSISFQRAYKVGDVDKYSMTIDLAGTMSMSMSMTLEQTVKKLYDNGDADIESGTADMKVSMNGQDMPNANFGSRPKTTLRMNKFGMPVGSLGGNGVMSALRSPVFFPDHAVKVGETIPINIVDPKNPKSTVTGTIKVDSIADGVAKLISDLSISSPASDKPMISHGVTLFDTAHSRMKSTEGEITNLPVQGGMQFSKATFKMVRLSG